MANKVCTLQEAVAKYVEDGDAISFGGFTTNKKPMAAIREILRQGKNGNKQTLRKYSISFHTALHSQLLRKLLRILWLQLLQPYKQNEAQYGTDRKGNEGHR